ncbi:hypothetical protein K435DRAFT_461844 [Dendrothele bispora CBS 962.96]|uniref:Uncharacterized protein n=1 Tax=Dendrothele bispora (strain CBS 962.96) TaxID=1314807 RepID=A0A4S8MDY3_DENBC|nr:hypothetical protein K435DRAFT_461844 [Dendrothele bispora CBS 962.96]
MHSRSLESWDISHYSGLLQGDNDIKRYRSVRHLPCPSSVLFSILLSCQESAKISWKVLLPD